MKPLRIDALGLWLMSHLTLILLFLYVPIAVLIGLSFNEGGLPTAWTGFSWKWYSGLLENHDLMSALLNSLFVGLASSFLSAILGTGLAMGLEEMAPNPFLDALVAIPLIIPDIVLAIALLSFYTTLNMTLGLHSIVLSHTVFNIAFVCLIVRTRLKNFDRSIIEASVDLGAGEWTTFFRITLPIILPGIIAGVLLSFTLSVDEFIIAYFTAGAAGPASTTFPMKIYAMIRFGVTPDVNAIASLVIVVSFALVLISQRLNRTLG